MTRHLILIALVTGVGKIDGIVARDGAPFLATDFRGMLLSVEANGATSVLVDLNSDYGMLNAADLGFDAARARVTIPDLFGSNLVFVDLGER